MVTSQDLFAIEQGLNPVAPEGPEPAPSIHLPRPVPPQYPAGQDEKRTYEQYYRPFWRTKTWDLTELLAANPASGTRLLPTTQLDTDARFPFRALVVDNLSLFTFILQAGEARILIPAGVVNFVRPIPEGINDIVLLVNGTGTADKCILTWTEEPLSPNPGTLTPAGTSSNVTVTNFPATQPVSIAGTLPISQAVPTIGPANFNSVVATLPSTAVGARATRVSGFIRARKANAADIVVGGGIHLQPGDSITISTTAALTTTGTAGDIFDFYEEYN